MAGRVDRNGAFRALGEVRPRGAPLRDRLLVTAAEQEVARQARQLTGKPDPAAPSSLVGHQWGAPIIRADPFAVALAAQRERLERGETKLGPHADLGRVGARRHLDRLRAEAGVRAAAAAEADRTREAEIAAQVAAGADWDDVVSLEELLEDDEAREFDLGGDDQ